MSRLDYEAGRIPVGNQVRATRSEEPLRGGTRVRPAQTRARKVPPGGLPCREQGQSLQGRTCGVPREEPFSIGAALFERAYALERTRACASVFGPTCLSEPGAAPACVWADALERSGAGACVVWADALERTGAGACVVWTRSGKPGPKHAVQATRPSGPKAVRFSANGRSVKDVPPGRPQRHGNANANRHDEDQSNCESDEKVPHRLS